MKIFHDRDSKQLNVLDERFYMYDKNTYYPSVTTVLNYLVEPSLASWFKDVGRSAEIIAKEAAQQGTNVHNAIEEFLKGGKITWFDEEGNSSYTLNEWQMINKFVEFWGKHNPKPMGVEVEIVSEHFQLGGTLDLPCKLNGENWLIDHKTSKSLYDNYEIQLATYAMMWNHHFPDNKITKIGTLWLNAATKTEGKNGAIQGKGWQLKEYKSPIEKTYELFQAYHKIWIKKNPNYRPKNLEYPAEFQIKNLIKKAS